MNTYLFKKYLAVGAMAASFIGRPATLIPEASAEIPVETGHITVANGIGYKSHRWINPIPPPEATIEVPVETGHITVPLGVGYKGKSFSKFNSQILEAEHEYKRRHVSTYQRPHPRPTFIGKTPPVEIVITEADELLQSRRSVRSVTYPYFVNLSRVQAPVNIPIDELLSGRRATFIPPERYAGQTVTVQPPIPAIIVVEADELANSRRLLVIPPEPPYKGTSYSEFQQPTNIPTTPTVRFAAVPIAAYSGKVFTSKTPPPVEIVTDTSTQKVRFQPVPIRRYTGPVYIYFNREVPDVAAADNPEPWRRYVEQRPLPPYNYYGLAAYSKPTEIDNLLQSRRSQFIPAQPYRSKVFTQSVPPPTLIEANELTVVRRAIFNPVVPYIRATYSQFRQPDELDSTLGGRLSVVVPRIPYNGKSIIVLPQTPEIVVAEADEIAKGRRLLFTPVTPYAPNLSRVTLIQTPETVTVEAEELTVAKVRSPFRPFIYPVNLTRAIYRQLDEMPGPHTIVGQAVRTLVDQLVPPRAPLYARRLGEQIVIVVQDSTPWITWVANVSKRIQKQLNLTVTLDFPPTAAQSYNDALVTVIGARIGDVVSVAVHPSVVLANTSYFAFVSADNQVTIRFSNNHPLLIQDPPSAVFGILVQKQA